MFVFSRIVVSANVLTIEQKSNECLKTSHCRDPIFFILGLGWLDFQISAP
jgi:hypothetical protein